MSVVGIDVGSDSSHVAVARRAKIDVVQNAMGNRQTATAIGFVGDERLRGDAARSVIGQHYKSIVQNIKRYLGIRYDSADLREELKYVPVSSMVVPSPVGGGAGVGFKVRYCGTEQVFPAEQVMAAMLEELKGTAEAGLSSRVADCVVAVPAYWTDAQRRAMLDACRLADLNVLRLMNETTAVALQYGILRPLPEKETRRVLFVDVSHTATQVAVVAFKAGRLDVLATAADRHLGARNFDRALFDHLAADIKQRYKLDVSENAKAGVKLFKECARVKKVLSANTQTPYNIEYLMNDTDVSGVLKREEFEALCGDLVARLARPIEEAVQAAGVAKDDLYAVEVVGGGSRIPMVLQALTDWFGRDVSRTCDGDESVARGCALQCAMLSPSFKVRDFDVHDITPYSVSVRWGPVAADLGSTEPSADAEDSAEIVQARSAIPNVKLISFKDREGDFQVEAVYADGTDMPGGASRLAGRYVVSGVDRDAAKIKVKVRIDIHGITSVSSAHQLKETEVEVEVPAEEEQKKADEPTKADEPNPDAAPATPAPMETDDAATDAATAAAESSGAETSGASDSDAAPMEAEPTSPEEDAAAAEQPKQEEEEAKPKMVKVMKKKTVKTALTVVPHARAGLNEADFRATYEREAAMAAQDRQIRETHERRNEVESYVYDMRSAVQDGELREYVDDADRDAFVSALDATESWLYDDGAEAQKSAYVERLKELQKMGEPIRFRHREAELREARVTHLKSVIVRFELEAASEDEKFAHIEADDRNKVAECAAAADQWLEKKLQEQHMRGSTKPPAVTCAELDAKAREVEAACAPIMNKPKPAPKKEEEPAAAPAADADADMAPADGADAAAADADADADAADADTAAGDDVPMSGTDETEAAAAPMED